MQLNRLKLFVEMEPDLLLTPNTELSTVDLRKIEYVLVDPGIPRGQGTVARVRQFMNLLRIADGLNAKLILAVIPDDWDPRLNIKLISHGINLLRLMRLRTDYVPVVYIHGYHSSKSLYREVLNDAVIGVPMRFNTLSYPRVIECRKTPKACANDVAFVLSSFDSVHFGGPSMIMFKAISSILNSPFTNVKAKWISADTMIYRWRHDSSLPYRVLTRPLSRKWSREYIHVFISKLSNLHF